jgi:hypothetical protein
VVEDVPGCYLLADALTGLLKRRYMKSAFPIPPATFALMLVVGGVGFVLPIRLATASALVRPVARGILWIALPLGAAACFALMVRGGGFLAVHAGMAGFSLLTMMAGSFWVELARNRHRVAERNRRAVDNFQVTPDGTLTLAPPLRRSLRAEAPPAPPAAG